MHHAIAKLQSSISHLDTYTQLSVYGSWGFTVNSACINAAMRYVPDEPVDNGIESFTQYEAARRALIKDAEDSNLPSLLALQREITTWIYENDGTGRDLQNTLEFLRGNAPQRKRFEDEYEQRRRSGLKPGMSKKTFVDHEYERAVAQFNKLVALGEDAVRLCDTVTIENMSGNDVADWILESFEKKLIEKLHDRWEKLEFVRTNPRRKKQIRDSAAADQMMIAQVLADFNETVGFDADAADADEFLNGSLDDVLPQKAPAA